MRRPTHHAFSALLFALVCGCLLTRSEAWTVVPIWSSTTTATANRFPSTTLFVASSTPNKKRKPSRVTDPDGPTPDTMDDSEEEPLDPQDDPDLREIMSQDELPRPIPHQPWRRGTFDGCEEPIDVDWRQAAESVIYTAVDLIGGKVIDVTWYLTTVLVTLDDTVAPDDGRLTGPPIQVTQGQRPVYIDPNNPKPEEILDPNEVVYQRQTPEEQEEEKARNNKRWANKDEDDDPNEPHNPEAAADPKSNLYMNEETRATLGANAGQPEPEPEVEPHHHSFSRLTPHDLSAIAGAMLEALREVEDELHVLARHELIMASPAGPNIIETQKQFNQHRGEPVIVDTQDPWESNRSLKGRLVDRNTLDVIINQQGRLVTIPQVFVSAVRIPNYFKKEYDRLKAEGKLEKGVIYEVDGEEPYEVLEEYTGPMP